MNNNEEADEFVNSTEVRDEVINSKLYWMR
jgi:hypothetical protein